VGEQCGRPHRAVELSDKLASTDEIQTFVNGRVAAYKYPRVLWIMDELPKEAIA
jgi:acyl-coenzyme A synthetase/AMP-(fatty) acid ligase